MIIKFTETNPGTESAMEHLEQTGFLAGANFTKMLLALGNGNAFRGYVFMAWLMGHAVKARTKHPHFADGLAEAMGILHAEYVEFETAVLKETSTRQLAELGDLCAVANRIFCGEHIEKQRQD